MQYSNPRKEVVVKDWPYSRQLKTTCHFYIEDGKGKQRACRTTVNPKTGKTNAPKKLTYARKVLFVDGDDGKTYILQAVGWGIKVMQSNMRYQEEVISEDDSRFDGLNQMFEEVNIETRVNIGEV